MRKLSIVSFLFGVAICQITFAQSKAKENLGSSFPSIAGAYKCMTAKVDGKWSTAAFTVTELINKNTGAKVYRMTGEGIDFSAVVGATEEALEAQSKTVAVGTLLASAKYNLIPPKKVALQMVVYSAQKGAIVKILTFDLIPNANKALTMLMTLPTLETQRYNCTQ